jgi:preprotein translocase subunit YajC
MTLLNTFFLMAPPSGDSSPWPTFLMMGAIILVFWMFMIRPQAKKAKDQKKYIESMQKGDKVVTIAGIHGTINKVNDDGTIQLEVSPGSYMKIEKSAISLEWSQQINKTTAVAATEKK